MNAQNQNILEAHHKVYFILDYLFDKDVTVLSIECVGTVPVIKIQPPQADKLEGFFMKYKVKDGIRINEYHLLKSGCLITWENLNVH